MVADTIPETILVMRLVPDMVQTIITRIAAELDHRDGATCVAIRDHVVRPSIFATGSINPVLRPYRVMA